MSGDVQVRRLQTIGDEEIRGLSDVLIDCVEGGASVSFMHPMTREKAETFWRGVAESAARGERAIIAAYQAGNSGPTAGRVRPPSTSSLFAAEI
jgi:hypothetical protein